MPMPMAHGGEAVADLGALLELTGQLGHQAHARRGQRVAHRDRAAIGVHAGSSSAMPKCSRNARTCTANASLTSNASMSAMVRPACGAPSRSPGSGSAHDLGLDAHERVGHQPHPDRQAEIPGGLLVGQQGRGGAVVDTRGVAGGHLAVGTERRLEAGERLHGRARAHRLVVRREAPALLGGPRRDGDQVALDPAGFGTPAVLSWERTA